MNQSEMIERANSNFSGFLAEQGPHPEGYVKKCLKYPPWVVYEFGSPPRHGRILGMGLTGTGYQATLAVLRKYNQFPPLLFEREVFGIDLLSLTAVGVDEVVLAQWAK